MVHELKTLIFSIAVLGILIWLITLPGVYRGMLLVGNLSWAAISFGLPLVGALLWFHDGATFRAALLVVIVLPLMAWPYVMYGWPRLKQALSRGLLV